VEGRRILADLARAALAAGALAGTVLLVRELGGLEGLPLLVVGGGLGAAVYFGVAWLLGMRELINVPLSIVRKNAPG
jgi:hypothetical protein